MVTEFLEVPDGTIAYDDQGSGPLVVCVPSMGDVRAEYRFLAPKLVEAGYRVITMDVRGHGETSTHWPDYSVAGVGSDVIELIRSLNAGPAVIVGDSMAGGAAVWAAAENRELVSGLILLDPFVRGEKQLLLNALFSVLFSRPWGAAMWVKYYATLYPTRKPADFPEYCAALRANLAERDRLEALQQMLAASKQASEERLGRVTQPALVLIGAKDPDFKNPEAEAAWVAGNIRATYKMIPEAGHYPQAEMPEVIAPLIQAFLQEVSETREKSYAA